MADIYIKRLLKVVVAQLSQTIGWHSIQTTPLELMTDVLSRYLEELGKLMHRYAEQFGHTDPNLDDVGLAFRDMGINVHELEEYIRNVDCVACSFEVPNFPIPRESHLNFLKPGSREVVTRPVHVHEHLPPMHPEMEEEDYSAKQTPLSVEVTTPNSVASSSPLSSPKANVFKRPGDPVSVESPALKRARLVLEEEGRPLREISSVMMTTSGFLSPAREGKLPESRIPLQPSDSRSNSPQPSSYPMVPPEVKGEKKYKKAPMKRSSDGMKKLDKENKKKEHKTKGLPQTDTSSLPDDTRVKKLVSMKELSKLKALKLGALKMMAQASVAGPSNSAKSKSTGKTSVKTLQAAASPKPPKAATQPKAPAGSVASVAVTTAAASASSASTSASVGPLSIAPSAPSPPHVPLPSSTGSLSTGTPVSSRNPSSGSEKVKDSSVVEGKLLAEPDKQKLNIFKKISKVKEDKTDKLERLECSETTRDSRESSPGLVIDESEVSNRRDMRIAQIEDCIDAVILKSMESSESSAKTKTQAVVSAEETGRAHHPADVSSHQVDNSSDVYVFEDDLFPPGTPSTPKTPELPVSVVKVEKSEPREQKEKKKKKDKSKSKRDSKNKTKVSGSPKKIKTEIPDVASPDWPKTPEGPEPGESTSTPIFPFFQQFQPGLIPPPIPHTLLPRFPLSMGKNLPHPAMPNLPMPPPLFMQSRPEESDGKEKVVEKSPDKPPVLAPSFPIPTIKLEKEREKEKGPVVELLCLLDKKIGEKKTKEHKKEKKDKDKARKKKERKEKLKSKEKEEKKKIKSEKKEKDKEKIKEKKEKKEKKKEKEREEKSEGGVPKITFKLGLANPRPPTPDATLRKIVIKPLLKKQSQGPDEESEKGSTASCSDPPLKREPSPELARISALITRPPRQKTSSKTSFLKQEPPADGFSTSAQPGLPPSSSVVCAPTVATAPIPSPTPLTSTPGRAPSPASSMGAASAKAKKALKPTKAKAKEVVKKPGADSEPQKQPIAFYIDNEGQKVWFCPACGGPDDGSPMIGCDDCDAWYHWVCVGIQVPPDKNEDWYCRVCIVKKQENVVDKKKKSRKRKMLT